MHGKKILQMACAILLSGSAANAAPFGHWAAEGVITNKTFRSTPLSHSLGVDGIYKFEVRDKNNKVRRQMVTREVFLAYEIGQEFAEGAAPAKQPIGARTDVRIASVESKKEAEPPAEGLILEPKSEIKNRVASIHFTQDMLPETEGF